MARKKVDEPLKPDAPPEISLLRVEERTERVSITPEQKVERMTAAAAVFSEAAVLDTEVSSLADTLKAAKQRAAAKHDEGERIIMDAQQGTMAQPYPVIVERHPTHPAEMIVWRVPDGVLAADIIETAEEGEARLAAREAQGCTLVENRAMWPEELELAAAVDHAHQNPTLPLPLDPPVVVEGELAAGEQPTGEEIAAGNAAGEDVGEGQQPDGDEPAAKKRGAITCPFIREQPDVDDPARDVLCGAAGAGRRKGFCTEHYELTGGATGNKTQKLALTRRTARKQLAEEAKGAAKEAAGEVDEDEPDEDEDDDGAGDADAEVSIQ